MGGIFIYVAEINTLLAIVRYGNISTAADKLYISQPVLSRRIQSLENELGYQILDRKRGSRTITLTPQGERLIQLAEQWSRLWEEMQSIGDSSDEQFLHFSAINSLASYVIYPVINMFMQTHPHVHFSLETQHSYNAIGRVLSGFLEGAFICNITTTRSLAVIPMWNEPMYLVAGQKIHATSDMDPNQLDIHQEIRVPWNNEFDEWHNYWFGPKSIPLIHIDQMSSLEQLMINQQQWLIAPITAATRIAAAANARLIQLKQAPSRSVYFISSSDSISISMKQFLNDTLNFISQIDGIRLATSHIE